MAIGTTLKVSFDGTAVKRGLASMKQGLGDAAKVAGLASAAVVGIGFALVAAAKKALDFGLAINKLGESERAADERLRGITKTIGLFGDGSSDVSDRLLKLADDTARLVGVDDNLIKQSQSLLLTFKGLAATASRTGGNFDRATMAALDLSAAGFGSVDSAAIQLGKALENPIKGITALARSGVTFTAQEKEKIQTLMQSNRLLEAQDIILKAVEGQVGGTAAAVAQSSDRIKVAMDQVKGSFAEGFSTAFDGIADDMDSVFAGLNEPMKNLGQRFGDSIRAAFAGNSDDLVQIGTVVGSTIGEGINIGLKAAFTQGGAKLLGLWEKANSITGLPQVYAAGTGESMGTAAARDEGMISKREFQSLLARAGQQIRDLTNPANNPNRVRIGDAYYQPTNQTLHDQPDLYQNGQAYKLLERIEANTRPAPL